MARYHLISVNGGLSAGAPIAFESETITCETYPQVSGKDSKVQKATVASEMNSMLLKDTIEISPGTKGFSHNPLTFQNW